MSNLLLCNSPGSSQCVCSIKAGGWQFLSLETILVTSWFFSPLFSLLLGILFQMNNYPLCIQIPLGNCDLLEKKLVFWWRIFKDISESDFLRAHSYVLSDFYCLLNLALGQKLGIKCSVTRTASALSTFLALPLQSECKSCKEKPVMKDTPWPRGSCTDHIIA